MILRMKKLKREIQATLSKLPLSAVSQIGAPLPALFNPSYFISVFTSRRSSLLCQRLTRGRNAFRQAVSLQALRAKMRGDNFESELHLHVLSLELRGVFYVSNDYSDPFRLLARIYSDF